MSDQAFNVDAYAPAEMAKRVETVGVAKANLDTTTMFALAVLAGAFIALGANVATIFFTDHGLGYKGALLLILVYLLGVILLWTHTYLRLWIKG
jgi:formate transporter